MKSPSLCKKQTVIILAIIISLQVFVTVLFFSAFFRPEKCDDKAPSECTDRFLPDFEQPSGVDMGDSQVDEEVVNKMEEFGAGSETLEIMNIDNLPVEEEGDDSGNDFEIIATLFEPTREKIIEFNFFENPEIPVETKSCGTKFEEVFYGESYYDYQGEFKATVESGERPLLENIENVKSFASIVCILVYNPRNTDLDLWWIRRAKRYGVAVWQFRSKAGLVELFRTHIDLKGYTTKQWILLVNSRTYVFITNLLRVIKDKPNIKPIDQQWVYEGFPMWHHPDMNADEPEFMYLSADAGVLLSIAMARILIPGLAELGYCRYRFDVCLGKLAEEKNWQLSYERGYMPDNPEMMLEYLDRARGRPPSEYVFIEEKNKLIFPIIAFGNSSRAEHAEMEKVRSIPKILHQVWLGDQTRRPQKLMDTCKTVHKDWQYVIWTDDTALESVYGKKLLPKTREICGRADIVRMSVLFRYGGMFIDVDKECVRALDPWIIHTRKVNGELFCGCENEEQAPGLVGVDFLGSPPITLTLWYLLRMLYSTYLYEGAWRNTGPLLLTRAINYLNLPVNVIESKHMNPVYHVGIVERESEMVQAFREDEDVYMIHYWASHNQHLYNGGS